MRRNLWGIGLLFGCSLAGNAVAQGPVVDGVYIPHGSGPDPEFIVSGPLAPTDIPLTSKVLSLPAGTAVITWNISCLGGGLVKPAIGTVAPPTGLRFVGGTSAGTWTTHIDGGQTNVRLQVEIPSFPPPTGQFEFNLNHNATWSLVVIPDSPDAPAMGAWGVAILAILLATAGSVVLAKGPMMVGAVSSDTD